MLTGIDQTLVLFLYPPAPVGYGFSNLAAGLFYIAPMSAVIVGELFGHFFSNSLSLSLSVSRSLSLFLSPQSSFPQRLLHPIPLSTN